MTLSVPVVVGLMLVAYMLLMGYLAVGVRLLRRQAASRPSGQATGRSAARPSPRPVRAARAGLGRARRGWPGLIGQVLGTAVGGYVVLMAVLAGYDLGVRRSGGGLAASALTGCALLIGIALPIFLVASCLWARSGLRPRSCRPVHRVRRRRGRRAPSRRRRS